MPGIRAAYRKNNLCPIMRILDRYCTILSHVCRRRINSRRRPPWMYGFMPRLIFHFPFQSDAFHFSFLDSAAWNTPAWLHRQCFLLSLLLFLRFLLCLPSRPEPAGSGGVESPFGLHLDRKVIDPGIIMNSFAGFVYVRRELVIPLARHGREVAIQQPHLILPCRHHFYCLCSFRV